MKYKFSITMLIVVSLFIVIYFNERNDFEARLIESIKEDNYEIGKLYRLNEFMTGASYNLFDNVDYIIFSDGFNIERDYGYRSVTFMSSGFKVKTIRLRLHAMGELDKEQILSNVDSSSIYKCTPNSSIRLMSVDRSQELYYIKPINCIQMPIDS